ncbi:MAG TPA: hypothetical protein VGJ18_12915 [Gemmatimonadaceae bacterium]|jgi:hypothetical protein
MPSQQRPRLIAWVAIALAISGGSVAAQSDSAVAASFRRDSSQYVRDSISVDSLSRIVPVDSLRRLYEMLYSSADPRPLAQQVECEAFRQFLSYGVAARIAQKRVRDAVVARLDPDAEDRLSSKMAHTTIEDDRLTCGAARPLSKVPARLRRAPTPPQRLRSTLERARIRDSLRRAGAMDFEATVSGSANAELAGSASLTWWTPELLGINLLDYLYPPSIISITFVRRGAEFFRVGSYPIAKNEDRDAAAPGVVGAYVQMSGHDIGTHRLDLVSGVLYVDRADTLNVEGHFDVMFLGHALRSRTFRRTKQEIEDTLHINGRFRARYQYQRSVSNVDRRWWPNGHPAAKAPAPDYREILGRADLDEHVPCDSLRRLPNGNPFLRIQPTAPAIIRRLPGTVALQFEADSLGRIHPLSLMAMSSSDTMLEGMVVIDSARRAPIARANAGGRLYRCTLRIGGR